MKSGDCRAANISTATSHYTAPLRTNPVYSSIHEVNKSVETLLSYREFLIVFIIFWLMLADFLHLQSLLFAEQRSVLLPVSWTRSLNLEWLM